MYFGFRRIVEDPTPETMSFLAISAYHLPFYNAYFEKILCKIPKWFNSSKCLCLPYHNYFPTPLTKIGPALQNLSICFDKKPHLVSVDALLYEREFFTSTSIFD